MEVKDLMIGFKYIPQYEGLYSIDRVGNVYSHISGKILKPHSNHRGYLMVDLYKDGKVKKGIIHKLVAITYIPNPNNLPEIDHIDTNRQNNSVENLRWCTRKENCNNPLSLKHSGDSKKGEKHYLYGKSLSKEIKAMIGDWVYRPDCYDKVKEIRENGIIGCDYLRGIISFKELEPIPLTPEILEKNGFEKEEYGLIWKSEQNVCDINGFPRIYAWVSFWKKGCIREVEISNIDTFYKDKIKQSNTYYVHELQHALRLCGIEKEITL